MNKKAAATVLGELLRRMRYYSAGNLGAVQIAKDCASDGTMDALVIAIAELGGCDE